MCVICCASIVCQIVVQALYGQTAEQSATVFENRMRSCRFATYGDIAAIIAEVGRGPWTDPLKSLSGALLVSKT